MPFESFQSFQEEEGLVDKILESVHDDLVDQLEDLSDDELITFKKKHDLLPVALKELWESKWVNENADYEKIIADLDRLNDHRKREGFEKITGYHVSNKDLEEGAYLEPDQNGEVFYSDNIENLYGKYAGDSWLYAVEGTTDDSVINEDLGWRTTKGRLKIVGKVSLDEARSRGLNWGFADCEYH